MDEARKKAYRLLLYHAMLDIRLIQWSPRSWNPFRWRRHRRLCRKAGMIADELHNLAHFSALDFVGFDEDWFWREFRRFNEGHPDFGVSHYQGMFDAAVREQTSFQRRLKD